MGMWGVGDGVYLLVEVLTGGAYCGEYLTANPNVQILQIKFSVERPFKESEVHDKEDGFASNSFKLPMGLPESSTDSLHLLNFIINSKKKKKPSDNNRVKIMLPVLISFLPLHNSLVFPTFWQLFSLAMQQ